MKPFNRTKIQGWIWPVSLIAMLIGFMASAAWITDRTQTGRIESLPEDIRERLVSNKLGAQAELISLHEQIDELRAQNTKLENLVAEGGRGTKELNNNLQSTKLMAGLTEVVGPGITVELNDSKKSIESFLDVGGGVIHDTDILKIVNELWNAGAEAVSVNGRRVGPRTNFRCVGSTVLVDGVRIAPPIQIEAIGDQQTLLGAVNMPGGPLDEIRSSDPGMVLVNIVPEHRMPAFSGAMGSKYAKLPERDTQ